MLKIPPHPDYPVEPGRYLRGNDYSPAAVAIILTTDEDNVPPEIELLVRAGIEAGAALSGTVQTPNIGAVWSCFQEKPAEFMGYTLYDIGAYPAGPLSGKLTWNVTQPWLAGIDTSESAAIQRAKELMERLKARNQAIAKEREHG